MMVRTAMRSVLLVLAVLPAWTGTAQAQDLDALLGRRITAVRLTTGGRETRDAQVESLVDVHVGQALTMAAARDTIVHVMSMGRFIDVRLDGAVEWAGEAGRSTGGARHDRRRDLPAR